MSELTPGDDVQKLLDRGYVIVMFKNGLGSFTAVAFTTADEMSARIVRRVSKIDDDSRMLTDDFTPDKALRRLTDKMLGLGEYREWPPSNGGDA